MEAPSGQGCPIRIADKETTTDGRTLRRQQAPALFRRVQWGGARATGFAPLDAAPPDPAPLEPGRPPQPVLPGLHLFAPNRECQGGSAWWLELRDGDLLIDVPALSEANIAFLRERAARRGDGAAPPWIVLTGRDGHGQIGRAHV